MPPTFMIHDFGPDCKVQCWNFTIHDFGMDCRIQLVYIFNPFQPQPCNLILNPSIMLPREEAQTGEMVTIMRKPSVALRHNLMWRST